MSKERQRGIISDPAIVYDSAQNFWSHQQLAHTQVNPNNFGTNINITNSLTPVTFNLPVDVFNWYDAQLSFNLVIPAVTANPGARYIWLRSDVWSGCIQHIQHYVQTNQYIVDLDYIQNYVAT